MFVFYLNIEVLVISLASGSLRVRFLLPVSMERVENRKPGVDLERRYYDKCIVLALLGERQNGYFRIFIVSLF